MKIDCDYELSFLRDTYSFNEINDRVPLRRMATEGFRNDSNEWIVDSSESKLGDGQNEPTSQNLSILNPAALDPDATEN